MHVLPSWFETTGLSSLEAAAMKCNVVITEKGDAREYFEDYGFYCNPDSIESIFTAVKKASAADFDKRMHKKIYANYTWLQTAEQTLEAYRQV